MLQTINSGLFFITDSMCNKFCTCGQDFPHTCTQWFSGHSALTGGLKAKKNQDQVC